MRIHRVEIEGFGPFRARQVVDLDRYAADGLFLIGGRTGAGKSSILDAIAFALFGTVPRYDTGEKRLRSDHCEGDDPTCVAVEFTTGERRWRIERSPAYDRPKKKGSGTTRTAASARMAEIVDGAEDWRAARDVDVANLVAEVVGLNQQQFLQVILLAQGRFAQFLLANNNERQGLLRTLFGSRRFDDYIEELAQRKKHAEAAVADGQRTLDAILTQADGLVARLPEAGDDAADGAEEEGESDAAPGRAPSEGAAGGSFRERMAVLAEAAERAAALTVSAETDASAATARREAAEAERDRMRRAHEGQRQRATLRETLVELEAETDEVARDRVVLAAARRADAVRAALDAVRRAGDDVASAAAAEESAREAWTDAGESVADPVALDEIAAAAHRRIGAWEPVLDIERALPGKEETLARLRRDDEAGVELIADLGMALATVPERRAAIDAHVRSATERAAARTHEAERVAELDARLEAAAAVAQLRAAYAEASAAADAALAARQVADAELGDLHRRRLEGYAGELASRLEDGTPCAVCGSPTHPAPAERADDHVTAEEIEAAERGRAEAAEAEAAAAERRRIAHQEFAAAEGRAGGKGVEALTAERAEAAERLARAVAAAEELAQAEIDRRGLDAEAADLGIRRDVAVAERTERAARIRSLEDELAADRGRIAEARGEADSVAERIEAERRRGDLAAAFARASRELDAARASEAEAVRAQEAALAEAGFPDVETAHSALRPADVQEALEQRIADHATRLEATKSALAELEARDLPEDPVDLDGAEEAFRLAAAERDAAQERLGALRGLADELAGAVRRAENAHAVIAEAVRAAEIVAGVADAAAGRNIKKMDLETYVLAAELEDIVEAANRRLDAMSTGRYALRHTDALAVRGAASGLGLEVLDRFTGRTRPPRSLSGGETFLASLALALGLAEVVTNRAGGITLDTLFIDEGFGSLDAETLEVAMRTLDSLREGGRTVGVISHVEAMKEQIPAQLRVERTPHGDSRIVQ